MNGLRAPWMGSWKPPWELGRGRRWGDAAWALAAIAQAWVLGGWEGRWPRIAWGTGKQRGPWVQEWSRDWTQRPDAAWVSLLRHGSEAIPAERRGKREDELQAWCWKALLEGDGAPWMSLGTVLLDRPTRERWVALLGAVDAEGALHVPPFQEDLIPSCLRALPPGWWETLLGAMDAEGRLLPAGSPPGELPWAELLAQGPAPFTSLVLPALPAACSGLQGSKWLHEIPGQGFMLAPELRAWARGLGACPAALEEILPPTIALGDLPGSPVAEILAGKPPPAHSLPTAWTAAVQADLSGEGPSRAPEACGEPTLDRLRMRWPGGAPAPLAPGYPDWGVSAHPCGDPFHWMAEGLVSYRAQAMERSLRAFTWAHSHFCRLKSPFWAERAAANAAQAALFWGDLPGLAWWRSIQGAQPSPHRELEELAVLAVRDEWEEALPLLRRLISDHPHLEQPWYILAQRGMDTGRREWVEEALPHLVNDSARRLFEGFLGGFREPLPDSLPPDLALSWRYHLALRDPAKREAFWASWTDCSNQPLRLDSGLALLERMPSERTAARLLELQVLADRTGAPRHQQRLRPLWPEVSAEEPEDPAFLLREALARRGLPAWLVWGPPENPEMLGFGAPAPPGALSCLQRQGSLPPFQAEGRIWWGFPLRWEGGVVGHVLAALDPEAPPDSCAELRSLAPWVARLQPPLKSEPPLEGGELLADGSEPMASLLRELARVAPSELSLLILGATGSGKEITAREIHRRSGRTGPLVPVNCSALAESLLESELFGHLKGAFTGADHDRRGAIETADHGTLFLDEVADLSPRLQSLFLRVLQEREVRRVGSDRAIHVDVRFLAATHRSLEELAASGAFRRDLLYRLQGSTLRLPSLTERRHEFPHLVPQLVAQLCRDSRRPFPGVAPGLPQALGRLPWPGNFRELRHALERALLRCGDGPLKAEHFPELQTPFVREHTWEKATREFQRQFLLDALRHHGFRVSEASEALGLTRPALYLAARRVGLDLVAEREKWRIHSDPDSC